MTCTPVRSEMETSLNLYCSKVQKGKLRYGRTAKQRHSRLLVLALPNSASCLALSRLESAVTAARVQEEGSDADRLLKHETEHQFHEGGPVHQEHQSCLQTYKVVHKPKKLFINLQSCLQTYKVVY